MKVFGESPKHTVHGHEQVGFTDIANAGPFRIPAVGSIVAVAGFGETVGMPCTLRSAHEDERAMVPADGPDWVGGVLVARDAAGSGDFGELVTSDDLPIGAMSIPFSENAARDIRA